MVEKLFNYYSNKYKVEWLPNGDVVVYDKNIKQEEHIGFVPRAARITVKGYDVLQDKEVEIRLRGYKAIVAQHEMDHFNGVLFYDHINKKNPFEEIPNAMVIEEYDYIVNLRYI